MTLLTLVNQAGIQPKWVASTQGGEYHSACPACGGKDRFYIQPNRRMNKCLGAYCCRQCGIYGDTIKFAKDFLGISFVEAAQSLGITLDTEFQAQQPAKRNTLLQKPPEKWLQQSADLVTNAHTVLLNRSDTLFYLQQRGLPLSAVEHYKLGWIDRDIYFPRNDWGLEERIHESGKASKLWVPQGLIIPSIEQHNSAIIRIKVRRFNWHIDDKLPKYVAVSGSMNGLSIIGSMKRNVVIVVESELDALAIDYVAHDFVTTIAVGSNLKNPDNITDRLAQKAKRLLICHDNDSAGEKMFAKWKKLYSHAIKYATPIGKDIGEAVQQGLDLHSWLIN